MIDPGKVYLVGAGPGDPELLTVKALRLIRAAEVIVYDRLIPPGVLAEARADAELLDVGKAPRIQRLTQDDINRVLVERAQAGKSVVRLKGGDPLVFGRGGEEALACHEAGIPFEIVPGISSSYAVPAYAGIPLTHRELCRSFTIMTGHDNPEAIDSDAYYRALVGTGSTLVILMGVYYLPQIISKLLSAGLSPETPAAIIEWGTLPQQRVVDASAASLPQAAADAHIDSPAITVIGDVVKFRSLGMEWFNPGQNDNTVHVQTITQ